MLKTIEYLLETGYSFSVSCGKYILIFDSIITFNSDSINIKYRNSFFVFSAKDFRDSLDSIIATLKDDTFSEEYSIYEGTMCPICGKVYVDTTWHDYVDINTKEVLGSMCDNCISLPILKIYRKVGGVFIDDYDSTMTEKIRNYEELKSYFSS